MPTTFPTPSQVFEDYKTILKSLKPDLNVDDASSEPIIRGKVFSGVMSGIYGDQKAVDDDTFIKDARIEALERHGGDYDLPRQPATEAVSNNILFSGNVGAEIPAGSILKYVPTGVLYATQDLIEIGSGGTANGKIICQITGQVGNVKAPQTLTFVSPPAGVFSTATIVEDIAAGSDIESVDSYRARLLKRRQRPPAGGNQYDYPDFAYEASDTVRSVLIVRFDRGLGTVGVYITAGTTDIDGAVTRGESVIRIPSPTILAEVQDYYNKNAPLTDCPRVYAPTEVDIDVEVKVVLASGVTLGYIPADATNNPMGLTVEQLIQREVSRVLYKFPVGGRKFPGILKGFAVAADIESQLDLMLSAVIDSNTGLYIGRIPVLEDRQVQPLDGVNINKQVEPNQLCTPGTIDVVEGT